MSRPKKPLPNDYSAECSCGWKVDGLTENERTRQAIEHEKTCKHQKSESDPVNPSHYQGDYVMRIIEDFKLDFLGGQVVKYILRAGKKDGASEVTDISKAKWYLDRKLKNLEQQ